MNILITGGTGFIGSHLCMELLQEGHMLRLVTRNPEKYRESEAQNQQFVSWEDNFVKEMDWADAVINLAGESIFGQRWTSKVKDRIYNSRVDGTRQLAKAVNEADDKPEVFISGSAVGYYGDPGEKKVDEQSSPGSDFLARVVYEWEEAAKMAEDSTRLVIPRLGIVLEKGGGALKQMLPPFKMFVGGPVGSGQQYLPWIHMVDVWKGIKFMITNDDMEGAYNLCAPHPVTMRELADEIGAQLNRPSWIRVPEIALKLILGEAAIPVTASLNISSEKLESAGFEFTYRTLDIALADILNQ